MSTEIVVAIIGTIGTVIVAVIAAAASSRYYSEIKERKLLEYSEIKERKLRERIDDLDKQLSTLSLKANTLWEIYGEDVIRSARDSGMLAAQSMEVPTVAWTSIVSPSLAREIEERASRSARMLNSPYDVFVEVWQEYKHDLVTVSHKKNISITIITGVVLQICENAVNSNDN